MGTSKREPDASSEPIGREQDANREPARRELAPDRETELKGEIAFLRGLVESLTQSEAQTKAALREALKAMPKQLTAGALDGVAASSGSTSAPDREHFDGSASAERDPDDRKASGPDL